MYLKKIEIYGFKSFADRVTIDFNSGITGIVGPNGSGKSNIIDAVRWVLGEQSPKTLRGSRMEDIIFNGTSHRKPLGMAEVSLYFDNRDQILPIDYTEVGISRRIYRSGESEYLINKTPCRLKDIKEMLMDTGIGIDGYSLIGQGQIDKILSNRTEERRQLFEEAAGIVKYKARKEEAEKKLKNTNENLIRIEDIIRELESRIDPLKSESEKARKYLDLNGEFKTLELNLILKEIEEIKVKLESEDEQYKIVKEQMNNYLQEKEVLDISLNNYNQKINSIDNEIENLQQNYYETKNLLKKLEGDKTLFQEKISNIKTNHDRISKELINLENTKDDIIFNLNHFLKEKEELIDSINKITYLLEYKEKEYEETIIILNDEEKKLEDSKGEIIDNLNIISNTKSDINGLQALKDNILKRIEKIQDEAKQLNFQNQEKIHQKSIYEKDIHNIKDNIYRFEKEKNELINQNNKLNEELNEINYKFEKENDSYKELIAKKNLYEQMEKSYEGFSVSVKNTLNLCKKHRDLGEGIHGVVAKLMNLPKELEIAIEVALGYSMQYVICNTQENAKKLIKILKERNMGRVTFLPLDNIYGKDDAGISDNLRKIEGFIGKANQLITYSIEYEGLFKYLLGRTLIVNNINTATKISKYTKAYKIVTLDGDVINPSGTITGGSYKSKTTNIFSRKRKLKELTQKLEKSNKLIDSLNNNRAKVKECVHQNDMKIQNYSENINKININLVNKENLLNNIVSELESITNNNNKLNDELYQLRSNMDEINISIAEKKNSIASRDKKSDDLEFEISRMKEYILDKRKELDILKEEITTLKIKLASLEQKKENCINEIHRLETLNKERERNRIIVSNEISKLDIEMERFNNEQRKIEFALKDNQVLTQQIQYNINKSTNEKDTCVEKRSSITLKLKNTSDTLVELKDSLHKVEMKKTRLEIQKDSLVKKIWEKYELSYIDALNQKTKINDFSEAYKRLEYIKSEIRKIGEVNLNSINEFKEVNERFLFLSSQKNDLIMGRDSLKKVISELELTMKSQFINSIDKINKNFEEIFSQLFNGGTANLIIEDGNNVLESNIEIVAQPSGKKLQNINLLSGGEKSLTAIALLFAILRTKPTPFCILDEIEAALDDINIFRFADFLKEFSKNSQFIIITHRKGTMEIIDYLYGITMQEYGVSKIVSVKLTDVAS